MDKDPGGADFREGPVSAEGLAVLDRRGLTARGPFFIRLGFLPFRPLLREVSFDLNLIQFLHDLTQPLQVA